MKGINFSRTGSDGLTQWNNDFKEILVSEQEFRAHFPTKTITGDKPEYGGHWVKLTKTKNFGQGDNDSVDFKACWRDPDEKFPVVYRLGKFYWSWSGCGIVEHWFDDSAVVLKVLNKYCSNTGLTASTELLVAYQSHVKVDTFREDCRGDQDFKKLKFEAGVIHAGFVNTNNGRRKISYRTMPRSDFTGFAFGAVREGGSCSGEKLVPIIGDNLDELIELSLAHQMNQELSHKKTSCRHLPVMQAYILPADKTNEKSISHHLCTACRIQGVRMEELLFRNGCDLCPYFKRMVKVMVEKNDPLPSWLKWENGDYLSSYKRMTDCEWEAYEVSYIRRKDGFIRRSVVLLNTRTKESWEYKYDGFIPKTLKAFNEKFQNPRTITGLNASGPENPEPGKPRTFLTEAKLLESINKSLEQPLWKSADGRFTLLNHCGVWADYNMPTTCEIESVNFTGLKDLEEVTEKQNPQLFYTDSKGNKYYAVRVGVLWTGGLKLQHQGEEKRLSHTTGCLYFLRVGQPVDAPVPYWEAKEGEYLKELIKIHKASGGIESATVVVFDPTYPPRDRNQMVLADDKIIITSDRDRFYRCNWTVHVPAGAVEPTKQMLKIYLSHYLSDETVVVQ